ncbi:MAG: hypothetical protein QXM75_04110 [Candidatus Diapherotrites archaeon]
MIFKIYGETSSEEFAKEPKKRNMLLTVALLGLIMLGAGFFVYSIFFNKTHSSEKPIMEEKPSPIATQTTKTPPKPTETAVPRPETSVAESLNVSVDDSNSLVVNFKLFDKEGNAIAENGVVRIEVRNFFDKVLYHETFYVGASDFNNFSYTKEIMRSDINKSVDPRGYVVVEFTNSKGNTLSSIAKCKNLPQTTNVLELRNPENYSCDPEAIEGIYYSVNPRGFVLTVRFIKGYTFVSTAGELKTRIYNSDGKVIFEDFRSIKPAEFVFTNPYLGEGLSYYFGVNYSDVNLTPKSKTTPDYEKCKIVMEFTTRSGKILTKDANIDMPTK